MAVKGAQAEPTGSAEGLTTGLLSRLESPETLRWPTGGLAAGSLLAWGLTAVAILAGVVLRAWYVFHQPMYADEAVVGLMVQQILHGHLSAFYWGQVYGGAEPYLVVPLFAIFGSSTWALEIVPTILAAAAGLVTWRIARRLVNDAAIAALAGAVVWVVPQTQVFNSTVELGFRGVTLLSGLGLVLVALRIWEGQQTWLAFAWLGVLAGVGWWSSPEIVYYVVPAAWMVVSAIGRDDEIGHLRRWGSRLLVALVAFIVGALPWLWANVGSGFYSLNTKAFQLPANSPGYFGRLHIFFRWMLPMMFSLKAEVTGAWLFARPLSMLFFVLLLVACAPTIVLCLFRDARSRALAVAVLLFPFILALSPATWFWGYGRYANLGLPLIVLVLVVGVAEAVRLVYRGRVRTADRQQALVRGLLASLVMGVLVALSVANFAIFMTPGSTFLGGWDDPNSPSSATVADLEAHHIRYAYADYWVAYKLDFLSDNQLQITTIANDVDRWPAQRQAVREARSQAWLFTTTTGVPATQFGPTASIQGPDGMSETEFLAALQRLAIRYRIVQAGLVRAVIPRRAVNPAQVASLLAQPSTL
jgi:hypothetical protein